MVSRFHRVWVMLILSLMVAAGGGCTFRSFGDWMAGSVYASPVERQQIDDRMDAHWGKE